jgi:hypothetical protein
MERTALEFLHRHGYRRVAYIGYGSDAWIRQRAVILTRLGDGFDPPIEVLTAASPEIQQWESLAGSPLEQALRWIEEQGPAPAKKALKSILDNSPEIRRKYPVDCVKVKDDSRFFPLAVLVTALNRRRSDVDAATTGLLSGDIIPYVHLWPLLSATGNPVTALVAPNDTICRFHHQRWIASAGITCPRNLSLIAFDNSMRFYFSNLTSVDPGFGELGFRAFHLINGDIPLLSHDHEVVTRPFAVDNGSVEVPGRGLFAGSGR